MNWKKEKLGTVCEVIAGQSPPSSTYNSKGLGLPFFQGKADFGDHYPNVRLWCNEPNKIAEPNDVLLSVRAPVGPTNICNLQSCIGRGLAAIRSNGKTHFKYVYYYFKFIESKLANTGNGSTFSAITVGDVKNIEIPIPDCSTQQKVASILDKADELRRKDQQLLAKYDELLQSIFYQMFGDPVKNEKGWNSQKLELVSTKITDGKHGDCVDDKNSGYYFLSAKDLVDGELKYYDVRQIKKEDFFEVHKRTNLQVDDILLGNTGASIGKIGIVTDKMMAAKTTFQKSISIITVNKELSPYYLRFFLEFNWKLFNKTSSGSAMGNLLLSQIRNFNVFIPPLLLQNQFADIAKNIQQQKRQVKLQMQQSEFLFQSILQKAFKGELVK